MNVFKYLRDVVVSEIEAISAAGDLPVDLDTSNVNVEPPREASHGDAATNAALVLAKQARCKPRDIAEMLSPRLLARDEVVAVDIAGPGFVNLRLADGFWQNRLRDVLVAGADYGISNIGEGRAVNVEYVSANPTGPLHDRPIPAALQRRYLHAKRGGSHRPLPRLAPQRHVPSRPAGHPCL